jgi:hypothetical protein
VILNIKIVTKMARNTRELERPSTQSPLLKALIANLPLPHLKVSLSSIPLNNSPASLPGVLNENKEITKTLKRIFITLFYFLICNKMYKYTRRIGGLAKSGAEIQNKNFRFPDSKSIIYLIMIILFQA